MKTNRLEAFSDGVLAIIITIMVLEMKAPHGHELINLLPLWPIFISYILSFIYLGIYWNNHHHMLQSAHRISGSVLWANLHLLFWLSIVPFVTAWIGESTFASLPMAVYGFVLLMAAIAYWILQLSIIRANGKDSILKRAIGKDIKGKISPLLYILGIAASLISVYLAGGLYILVALIWLVPDPRIEKLYKEAEKND